jgi:hypothetical protein
MRFANPMQANLMTFAGAFRISHFLERGIRSALARRFGDLAE